MSNRANTVILARLHTSYSRSTPKKFPLRARWAWKSRKHRLLNCTNLNTSLLALRPHWKYLTTYPKKMLVLSKVTSETHVRPPQQLLPSEYNFVFSSSWGGELSGLSRLIRTYWWAALQNRTKSSESGLSKTIDSTVLPSSVRREMTTLVYAFSCKVDFNTLWINDFGFEYVLRLHTVLPTRLPNHGARAQVCLLLYIFTKLEKDTCLLP